MRTKFWNTKERGSFEFFVYPEGNKFVGVCLTLNIVEEGRDPQKILESLKEAAFGHLEVVVKENLGDELLNRPAPKKYRDKCEKAQLIKEVHKIMKGARLTPVPIKQAWAY